MNKRFAGLKQNAGHTVAVNEPVPARAEQGAQRRPREGKKLVGGYYSPTVSRGLHQLALDKDISLQGLLGEAIDDLMRKYGKHPFGER